MKTTCTTILITGLFASTATAAVTMNELRIDQSGTDNDEYFELAGMAGESLDNMWYIVIGDGVGGSGVIEAVIDLSGLAIPSDGFFLATEDTFTLAGGADLILATGGINFENSDNVTHMLLTGFTGALDDDLDLDDDGILDITPWDSIVDSLALIETVGSGDLVYSPNHLGPDGAFVPGHGYRYPDGNGMWNIGLFQPLGETDTPGTANIPAPGAIALLGLAGFAGRRRRA